MIRLKRITSKGLTQIFCLTVAHHDVLKDFLEFFSKIIGSISKTEKSSKDTMLLETNI